jgi:hypothetical protein
MPAQNSSVFLSYSRVDKVSVEKIARKLQENGIDPWLDQWNLIPGEPWQPAIEEALKKVSAVAVFIGQTDSGAWQRPEMEVAIDRAVKSTVKEFRVIPVLLPFASKSQLESTFLARYGWIEFGDTLENEGAFRLLLAGIKGVQPGPGDAPFILPSAECPYRGLDFFDVKHARFFFGREKLTEKLVSKLNASILARPATRFLGIVGASGSGKSSLARAGVLHKLSQGVIEGSSDWAVIVLTPGVKPLENLAFALSNLDGSTPGGNRAYELIDGLRRDESFLHLVVRSALQSGRPGRRAVILADQFEEVFAGGVVPEERSAFINNLLYAATTPEGPVVLLLTLRADRYADCASHANLRTIISEHNELIGEMDTEELRAAIERPAALAGVPVELALTDILLEETGGQTGCLPLLQYILRMMWEMRGNAGLTYQVYKDLGGIHKALERRAEEIYAGFSEAEQAICESIFLRLAQPGPDGKFYRTRPALAEILPSNADPPAVKRVQEVIGRLAEPSARLIVISAREAGQRDIQLEVAHEFLLNGWARLNAWLRKSEEFLLWKQRLNVKLLDWRRTRKAEGTYLSGILLQEAREWQRQRPAGLAAEEIEFIRESAKREASRKRRRIAAIAAVVLVAASIPLGILWVQRVMAARDLLMSARNLVATDTQLALLLGVHIDRSRRSVATQSFLQEALQAAQNPHLEHDDPNMAVYDVAFSGDERWMATAGEDKTVRLWNSGYEEEKRGEFSDAVLSVAFNSQSNRLIASARDGSVKMWDLPEWREHKLAGQNGLTAVAASPDGTRIATASRDGKVALWSVPASAEPLRKWDVSSDSVDVVAFSPDGARLAAGGVDFHVRLWSIANSEKSSWDTRAPVKELGFSQDGKLLLTGSLAGAARVWEIASGQQRFSFPPGETGLAAAVIDAGGTKVAVATADDKIVLYDLPSGKSSLEILRQKYSPTKLAFNSKAIRLAAANRSGKVRIYELDPEVLAQRAMEALALMPPAKADCLKFLSERDCTAYLGLRPTR